MSWSFKYICISNRHESHDTAAMNQFGLGAAKYEESQPTQQVFASDNHLKLRTAVGFSIDTIIPSYDCSSFIDDRQPQYINVDTWPSVDPAFGIYQESYVEPFDAYVSGSSQTALSMLELDRPANQFYNVCYEDIKPLNYVVPDQFSGVVTNVDLTRFSAESHTSQGSKIGVAASVSSGRKGACKSNTYITKGQWTQDEDRLLIQLVDQHGIRKWSLIAQMLPGRIGKQCRERWHNHLRPNIKKDVWTEEEDEILIKAHEEIGNKWAEIAKRLLGRTENSIKNHWNATKRKEYAKRKRRTKNPKPSSLLQDYIKSLKLNSSNNSSTGKRGGCSGRIKKNSTNKVKNCSETNTCMQPVVALASMCDEFCPSDRLVPDFDDFRDIPADLEFDDKMFEESNIESLLEDIETANKQIEEMDSDGLAMAGMGSLLGFQARKDVR